MKTKIILTIFTTITLLAQMPILSQTNPFAPESFSVFSLSQSLGVPVNTMGDESGACVAPNGLSLYLSSDASGTLGSKDIWVSQRPTLTSAWGAPQNLGTTINTGDIENLPTLSPDGKTMFFTSTRPGGFGSSDIYMTTRINPNDDFSWTAPVNLGSVINTSDGEIGASYFENPTNGTAILYFTSNRPGSLGGEDIYQSTRNANGTYNAPTNVAELNSASFDRNSAVRNDGLEIFFASERDGGLGGRDIWVSTRASVSAEWNPPVNVASVNSFGTDHTPSLSPNGTILYFSSDHNGSPDIYTATRVSINRSPTADFDGDGRTDLSVFRPTDGTWHILNSGTNTYRVQPFGANGDKITPGDYDGDSRTDLAVFRPSTGVWWIQKSSDNTFSTTLWGISTDKPVPADFDGDGRTDIAVYRNGVWYIVQSSNGSFNYQQFGLSSDIPVAGVQ